MADDRWTNVDELRAGFEDLTTSICQALDEMRAEHDQELHQIRSECEMAVNAMRAERDKAVIERDEARAALKQVTQTAVLASLSPSAALAIKRPCTRCGQDFIVPQRTSRAHFCPDCRRALAIEQGRLMNAAMKSEQTGRFSKAMPTPDQRDQAPERRS